MLALGDAVDQRVDVERVRPQGVGRDLTVQHGGRDVRVVGRDLPPALGAVVGADPDDADEFV